MMLKLLEGALALDKYRNYARAAEKIGVSQPTLTRNIQELERQFSVKLFDRARNGVQPTTFGSLVLEAAKRIEISFSELKREIALMKGLQTGQLKIGVGPLPAQTWMPMAIAELLATHPQLKLQIIMEDWWDIVPSLNEKRIDIGIGEVDPNQTDETIAIEPLPHRPLRFYCRADHPLIEYKHLTLEKIGHYPLVNAKLPRRAEEFLSGTRLLGELSDNGKYFVPQIECQSYEACFQIVSGCDAIGIAPLSKLESLNKEQGISLLKFEPPWLRTNYAILTVKDRSITPAGVAFLEKVKAAESRYFSENVGKMKQKKNT